MRFFSIAALFIMAIACSCQSKKSEGSNRSPEEVLREWQHLVDNNRFKEAMNLSTENTREMMKVYGEPFEGEPVTVETNFVSVNCKEAGDTAICKCMIKTENGIDTYEDEFHLLRQNGQWLVDLQGFDTEGEENIPKEEGSGGDL